MDNFKYYCSIALIKHYWTTLFLFTCMKSWILHQGSNTIPSRPLHSLFSPDICFRSFSFEVSFKIVLSFVQLEENYSSVIIVHIFFILTSCFVLMYKQFIHFYQKNEERAESHLRFTQNDTPHGTCHIYLPYSPELSRCTALLYSSPQYDNWLNALGVRIA